MEKQIEELRDMFVELAALVENQGEMIDRIETHVQKAEIDVEQGNTHLGKAKEYMEKARKKKLILAIIIAVILLILLLVILAEFGAFSSSSNNSAPVSTHTTSSSIVTSTTTSSSTSVPFNPPPLPNGRTEAPIFVPDTQN